MCGEPWIGNLEVAARCEHSKRVCEGVDVAVPAVGQIAGGRVGESVGLGGYEAAHHDDVGIEDGLLEGGGELHEGGVKVVGVEELIEEGSHRASASRSPVLDDRGKQLVLRCVRAVERRLGDPGAGCDLGHRGAGEARLDEDLASNVKQLGALEPGWSSRATS